MDKPLIPDIRDNEYRILYKLAPAEGVSEATYDLLKGNSFEIHGSLIPMKSNHIVAKTEGNSVYTIYFKPSFEINKGSFLDNAFPLVELKEKIKEPKMKTKSLDEVIDFVRENSDWSKIDGNIVQVLRGRDYYYFDFSIKGVSY